MKDPRPEEIKELTINGVLYAKYDVDKEKEMLFLKTVKNIIPDHDKESEDCIIALIGILEQTDFASCGYLNIE